MTDMADTSDGREDVNSEPEDENDSAANRAKRGEVFKCLRTILRLKLYSQLSQLLTLSSSKLAGHSCIAYYIFNKF